MNRRPWLTLENRRTIEEMYTGGHSVIEIAKTLNADRSVIYRELRRGRTGNADKNGRPEYKAEVAQEKAYWNQERLKQEV